MADEKFEEMTLIGHLTELRKRLMWSFFYILIIFVICFYFADELFAFLANPLVKLLDTENLEVRVFVPIKYLAYISKDNLLKIFANGKENFISYSYVSVNSVKSTFEMSCSCVRLKRSAHRYSNLYTTVFVNLTALSLY